MSHLMQIFVRRMKLLTVSMTGLITISVAGQTVLHPETMPKMAQVDSRYVSYNVEAIEITGGRFWKPFPRGEKTAAATGENGVPTANADPYQYRTPIDLSSPKLRRLASSLGPSYMRVSGTWRNSTYFQNDDASALAEPPKGFKGVMTRTEWRAVVDFAHATGAEIVTSVAMSDGTRDASGVWTPIQAKAFFDYTRKIGGKIAATEFMNEPTFPAAGGAPKRYDETAFAKDIGVFRRFLREESPRTLFWGPGSIGEGVPLMKGMPMTGMLSSEEMLKATGPVFDAFSYHFYTTLSTRCVGDKGLSWEEVLTPEYLNRNPDAEAYYAKLRDAYLPGKQMWLTETGEAGCGGDRWASAFVDAFRFTDQLGVLAQRSVQAVMVNTLASSDYGLLDESSLDPRPDYWIALLWKRLMGRRVLDPGVRSGAGLRVYAHCMKDVAGGVSVVALNIDQWSEHGVKLPVRGERYTLTAPELLSGTMSLNDMPLKAEEDGTIPRIAGARFDQGEVRLPPASITFFTLPRAGNAACR